jgi:hypothetical protein
LILVLADANNLDFESVTGKRLCAKCAREIVEIHRGNTRDFRHFRKCRVGGDEAVPVATREFNKAAVDVSCFERALFPGVSRAARRLRPELDAPGDQGCCGALHAHNGDLELGRELARLVNRDVKRVHEDSGILTELGLLERTESGGVCCPYTSMHIDMYLKAA